MAGVTTVSATQIDADSTTGDRSSTNDVDDDVTLVEADQQSGFNYPYFLYTPPGSSDPKPLLVEPVNTGGSTDDFAAHRTAAQRTVSRGVSRRIADELSTPLLVPVFPRPREHPVDATHYVHSLDDTTMKIDGGPLERVDRQLLAMADDARDRLEDGGYPVAPGLLLNGFSASGNFVDRFAALHPETVISVTAGGLNGTSILPRAAANGHALPYPVGIANVDELTGEPFDLEAFRRVKRFLYMGERDWLDTITFNDAWTDRDLREVALDVYGRNMHTERFPYVKAVNQTIGSDAVFRVYEDIGHTDVPAQADVVEFHRRVLDDDSINDIRADLGGNVPEHRAHIERDSREPPVGDAVTFDARYSGIWDGEFVEYEWEFDDGETVTGETVTRSFESRGAQNIKLTAIDDAGTRIQTVQQVPIGVSSDGVSSPDIVINAQESDGNSIVIDRITTPVMAMIWANPEGAEPRTAVIPAGVHEDVVYPLETSLSSSGRITVVLRDEHTGERLSEDSATVTVVNTRPPIGPTLVEADPAADFNYPYYLYAPARAEDASVMPVFVEVVNTGQSTDDFAEHKRAAKRLVEGNHAQGSGRVIAHGLGAPFVVPIFPRPRTEPVDGTHYVHSLDDTTMRIDGGPLERVDRQLLAMVEDARRRLRDENYPVLDGIMINGNSASGNFADRFAALHPEEVISVTAGGLNGMVVLPAEKREGRLLNYHVGIADIESITGTPVDMQAFADVNRLLFMGEFDPADTISFDDAWTDDTLEQTAIDVFGLNMQADRFPTSRTVFDDEGIDAVFRMYRDGTHSPNQAESDIIGFHRRSVAGDSSDALRADYGGNVPNQRATIRYAPERTSIGTAVAVHAIDSNTENIHTVEWDFGDGATAKGDIARHAYEEPGTYEISVTVRGEDDVSFESSEFVTIVSAVDGTGSGSGPDESGTDDSGDGSGGDTTSSDVPGFGIGATIAGVGGASYFLKRRLTE